MSVTPTTTRPLRVLVAHNAYQYRGGEDSVVEAEVALLREAGHEVRLLQRHNDEIPRIGSVHAALQTMWSRSTQRQFTHQTAHWRPDVVHVHNSFPLISPSLHWAAAAAGVPVVQTLHNFRLMCPQAMFLRDGHLCEDCKGRWPLPAVRHGCYRGSRVQSAVLAGMVSAHRLAGTWQHKITRYIALNRFCREQFIAGGLPAERIDIKPNFVQAAPPDAGQRREGLLFVGRLSPEKGVQTLLQAWQGLAAARSGVAVAQTGPAGAASAPVLRIVGEGPLADALPALPGVQRLGAQPFAQVMQQMRQAQALVLPSLWYENFPRTLVEAFAAGLPVIASRLGALAELVEHGRTGLLFNPGDADDLARVLRQALERPDELRAMGAAARRTYEQYYTPQANLLQLVEIYRRAGADVRSQNTPVTRPAAAP